jgi:arylsulfatase A-like enzyme
LRGQYPHNHGLQSTQPPDGGFEKFRDLGLESSTVAVWLRSAGYRTVLLGKYFNGYNTVDHVPPGWDEWYTQPGPAHFDYSVGENGTVPQDYAPDVLANKAADFITQTDGPFFMYLAPNSTYGTDRAHPESIQAVDDLIATVIHRLELLGKLGHTYIFFTSDNGYSLGQHQDIEEQGTSYEDDIRVPLMRK